MARRRRERLYREAAGLPDGGPRVADSGPAAEPAPPAEGGGREVCQECGAALVAGRTVAYGAGEVTEMLCTVGCRLPKRPEPYRRYDVRLGRWVP